MVVWIASYPRSGNTFVRMLLHHGYGLTTYSVFDDPQRVRHGEAWDLGHAPLPADPKALASRQAMYLIKTHRPQDAASPHPAIHVVRDGRDALVSCAHYQLRYGGSAALRAVRERMPLPIRRAAFGRALGRMIHDGRFGGWSGNVGTWRLRRAPTVTVRYEDLIRAPMDVLGAACSQLGVVPRAAPRASPTFEALHDRWPGVFRRGISGAWRDEMPDRIHRLFWQRHGEGMRLLGYAPEGTW